MISKAVIQGMIIGCDTALTMTFWFEFGKRRYIKAYRQACVDILSEAYSEI